MYQEFADFTSSNLGQRVTLWATKLAVSMAIFAGFIFASWAAKRIICRLEHRTDPQKEQVLRLIGDVARIALLIFGLITALGTLGINVSALVAGLGLTGFALGYAFHDALSNVLSGVMILLYQPFHRGDQVSVAGLDGKVIRIDLRYTTLENETSVFLIPNSMLLTNAITLTRGPKATLPSPSIPA